MKSVLKAKASSWKGELIDKLHKTKDDENNRTQHFYTLVFKTEEGKDIKIGTSFDVWKDYKIGDKVEKKAGKLWPDKL